MAAPVRLWNTKMDTIRENVLFTETDILLNSANRRHYQSVLQCGKETQTFRTGKTSAVEEVVGQINCSLSVKSTRLEGLLLLEQCIQQCSSQMLQQHAVSWARTLTTILQGPASPMVTKLCASALTDILAHAAGIPELSREFATTIIPSLAPVLISSQCLDSTLPCLAGCLKQFSGSCGPFRNKIEKLVVPLLCGDDKKHCEMASQCYTLLTSCGGGGLQGVKHKESWGAAFDKLLASLHEVLDLLYGDYETSLENYQRPAEGLPLRKPGVKEPSRTLSLTATYSCLVQTICSMLNVDFPALVHVPLEDCVDLVCRTLHMTPKPLVSRPTRERLLLASMLPLLQTHALKMLSALILGCGSGMMPYADTVNHLFTQTLSWSAVDNKDTGYGQQRPFSQVRGQVYSSMVTWLKVLGACADMEGVASELLQQAMEDARPQVDTLKLQSTSGKSLDGVQMQSGKRKRKHGVGSTGSAADGQISGQRKVDATANCTLAQKALEAIAWLLSSHGPLLQASHLKTIQRFVVPLLVTVSCHPSSAPLPYTSAPCRHALYQVLVACLACPHPELGAPTQCAAGILQQGQHDPHVQIASFCREKMTVLESIVHPRAPPLSLAPEQAPMNTTLAAQSTDFLTGRVTHWTTASVNKAKDEESDSDIQEEASVTTLLLQKKGNHNDKEDEEEEMRVDEDDNAEMTVEISDDNSGSDDSRDSVVELDSEASQEITSVSPVKPNDSSVKNIIIGQVDDVITLDSSQKSDGKDNTLDSIEIQSDPEPVASTSNSSKQQPEIVDQEKASKSSAAKTNVDEGSGPSVEEMLLSFVDADAD